MILFPAIDLKDGKCVRLLRGDMDKSTVFNDNPGEQAARFEAQGFSWIHIVDLNGAFAGQPVNAGAVKSILQSVSIPVQLGGGIRDLDTVSMWLDAGVRRVILGTAAVRDPAFVKEACRLYPERVVVGIDAKEGKVAVEGWAETSEMDVVTLAKRFEDVGVAAIVYTDISRDGAMMGFDVEGTKQLAQSVSIPIIASGGISSLEDLKQVRMLEPYGVVGVISGRAIYDGRIIPNEALALC